MDRGRRGDGKVEISCIIENSEGNIFPLFWGRGGYEILISQKIKRFVQSPVPDNSLLRIRDVCSIFLTEKTGGAVMKICGILRIAAVLFADFILLYLGLGLLRIEYEVLAAVLITGGIFAYGWAGEYLAVFRSRLVPEDQLDEKEKDRLKELKEYLTDNVRRVSGRDISALHLRILESDQMHIFTYGSRNVVIARSYLNSCDEAAACSVLAREVYHVFCMDSFFHRIIFANVSLVVGGTILVGIPCLLLVWLLLAILWLWLDECELLDILIGFARRKVGWLIGCIVRYPVWFVYWVLMRITGLGCEFRADRYSCRLGYGSQLIDFLPRLAEIDKAKKKCIYDIMYASYPPLQKRLLKIGKENAALPQNMYIR